MLSESMGSQMDRGIVQAAMTPGGLGLDGAPAGKVGRKRRRSGSVEIGVATKPQLRLHRLTSRSGAHTLPSMIWYKAHQGLWTAPDVAPTAAKPAKRTSESIYRLARPSSVPRPALAAFRELPALPSRVRRRLRYCKIRRALHAPPPAGLHVHTPTSYTVRSVQDGRPATGNLISAPCSLCPHSPPPR